VPGRFEIGDGRADAPPVQAVDRQRAHPDRSRCIVVIDAREAGGGDGLLGRDRQAGPGRGARAVCAIRQIGRHFCCRVVGTRLDPAARGRPGPRSAVPRAHIRRCPRRRSQRHIRCSWPRPRSAHDKDPGQLALACIHDGEPLPVTRRQTARPLHSCSLSAGRLARSSPPPGGLTPPGSRLAPLPSAISAGR
jgi:hypothetical protein